MFGQNVPVKVKRLEKQIADLQAEIDGKDRIIRVLETELETMAAVMARDRERIRAEGAAYARQRAESEGTSGRSN